MLRYRALYSNLYGTKLLMYIGADPAVALGSLLNDETYVVVTHAVLADALAYLEGLRASPDVVVLHTAAAGARPRPRDAACSRGSCTM